MKIIEYGKPDVVFRAGQQYRCTNCFCLFELEEDDIIFKSKEEMDVPFKESCIRCPRCRIIVATGVPINEI